MSDRYNFNTAEEFLQLVDKAKQSKASDPDTQPEFFQSPVQDFNISYTVKILKGSFTLIANELDLEVTSPDYQLAKEIIVDLSFVEVNRKYYGTATSLGAQMILILKELDKPDSKEEYTDLIKSYSYKLPSADAVEYVLGDWESINSLLAA